MGSLASTWMLTSRTSGQRNEATLQCAPAPYGHGRDPCTTSALSLFEQEPRTAWSLRSILAPLMTNQRIITRKHSDMVRNIRTENSQRRIYSTETTHRSASAPTGSNAKARPQNIRRIIEVFEAAAGSRICTVPHNLSQTTAQTRPCMTGEV